MKLLEKSKINEDLNRERKNVVDSGIFLAKKIDTLRQDVLSLEKQRDDFIKGSQRKLEEALKELSDKKTYFETEIDIQEKKLAKLREPLDEEWSKLEKEKDAVIRIKKESEEYFTEVVSERISLQKQKAFVSELEGTVAENENTTYKLLQKIENDRRETKKILSETQILYDIKEAQLFEREQNLSTREKTLETGKKEISKEREIFNKEKKALEIKKSRWNKT